MWDPIIHFFTVTAVDWLLLVADPLLNWMLKLPRDLALVILAVLTGVVMTLVRRWTTNQDLLRRCKQDKARLGQLMKEAKQRGDKEFVKNIRMTNSQIAMENMKAEGKPLLYSLLPIVILATWAFSRIAYLAPLPDEQVTVHFYVHEPQIGSLVALLPEDGVTVHNDRIQVIDKSYREILQQDGSMTKEVDGGMATWQITAQPRQDDYTLKFSFKGKVYEAPFRMDGHGYAPNYTWYYDDENVICSETKLNTYKPAGVIPSVDLKIAWLGLYMPEILPAWLLGYLILVLPLTFILRPVLRTC